MTKVSSESGVEERWSVGHSENGDNDGDDNKLVRER